MNPFKFLAFSAIMGLLFGLSACSTGPDFSSPEVVIEGLAEAMKSNNKEAVSAYLVTEEEMVTLMSGLEGGDKVGKEAARREYLGIRKRFDENYADVMDEFNALKSKELKDFKIEKSERNGAERAFVKMLFDESSHNGHLKVMLLKAGDNWKMVTFGL